MKKYKIDRLFVELTRKCNYKCAHCMRGDAQALTITADIIDAMFSQCDGVYEISLIGGESLLEIDALKMLLKKIDEYKIGTKVFTMVTNGSILDISVLDAFYDFVNGDSERRVSLTISDDSYHDLQKSKAACKFYKYNNKKGKKIFIDTMSSNNRAKNIPIPDDKAMEYGGRMVDTYNQNPKKKVCYPEDYFRFHQICISSDNTIRCMISLFANGNLSLSDHDDYNRADKRSIGNILNESLDSILERHNDTCPFLCDECYTEMLCKNMIDFSGDTDKYTFLYYKLLQKRNEYVWILRQKIKERYPHIPMRAIINATPVKELWAWCKDCVYIEKGKQMIDNDTMLMLYESCKCADSCITMLKDIDISELSISKKLANIQDHFVNIDVCKSIPDSLDSKKKDD